ncbi:MAG: DUF481 domain-containing protein [Sulfurovum sp.]|nr:DUF481 domain-containing protein [Sulfurovum sp.]
MCINMKKIFTFLLLFTILLHSGGSISKEEEIKDTIVVHGMVFHGRVMNLGPEKLSFKLLYSEGINHIAYKDIESISTKYNYHISFKRMDIEGRIVGIENNTYLKVMEGENERTIKITDIDNFVMAVSDDASFENRIRNKFPFSKGNINVGFEIESGGNQKNELDILLNLKYKKAEHEFKLYVDYQYDTTKVEGTGDVLNKDELVGILMYKNNFKNDQFYYTIFAADYDRPRHILNRWIPSIGYGHRLQFSKNTWLEPSVGLAYVATTYTEEIYPDKDFAAAALNLAGKYRLNDIPYINSLIIDGFLMYYPSLEDLGVDWVLRSNVTFTIPLFDFFSVKLSVNQRNDSNPDPSVGNNKTTTNLLFGLDF